MKVLVDTSVWSLALRCGRQLAIELRNLIADGRVRMIGPIRQEILLVNNEDVLICNGRTLKSLRWLGFNVYAP